MKNKKIKILIFLFIIFILSLLSSIFISRGDFGFNILNKIFDESDFADKIIFETLRLPRAFKALVAGICLAQSGMMLQAVSKNPLAEPYITGVSSGAGIGIVISIVCFSNISYPIFGFFGALITALLVILFAGLGKFSITKLILTGLCVNLFAGSLISLIILTNPKKAYSLMYILSGGIVSGDLISNFSILILFLFAIIACLFIVPKLNFLRLDHNLINSINKNNRKDTIIIILLSSYLASISVFCVGIIGFVGIIIPQISNILFKEDYRWLFVSNIFLGAGFMLFSDFLSRIVFYPVEIPLGLIVSLLGAPVFIYFLTKKEGKFNE